MDIIFSGILPKLPVKSLLRFKCVSKSFLAKISSDAFIKLQHLNALSSEANRLLILPSNPIEKFRIYDIESPRTPPFVCPFPKAKYTTTKVAAFCECFLLMQCNNGGGKECRDLVLVNPITRTYLQLPAHKIPYQRHNDSHSRYGMCHCLDEFNDYYKVVRFRKIQRPYDSEIEYSYMQVFVYSTRTNLWKLVDCEITDEMIISSKRANGILLQKKLLHFLFSGSRVRCFDMEGEQWTNDVPLPDYSSHSHHVNPEDLGVLDGNLCLIAYSTKARQHCNEFWVMKEYGVKESWVKLISLGISNNYWQLVKDYCRPIAYCKGSQHELLCKRNLIDSGILFCFNLEDKKSYETEFEGVQYWDTSATYICKGSLLNFPGGQLIENSGRR